MIKFGKQLRVVGQMLAVALMLSGWTAMAQGFGGNKASVKLSVVPGSSVVEPGDSIDVMIELTMAEHWHTYWKYAGPDDTGFPPALDWSLPESVTVSEIEFEAPDRFVTEIPGVGDSVNYGYSKVVRHLVKLTVAESAKKGEVIIGGEANWLACKEGLCLPGDAEFSFSLVIGDATEADPKNGPIVASARAKLPADASDWTFTVIAGEEGATLTGTGGVPPKELRFVPNGKKMIDEVSEQEYSMTKDGFTLLIPGVKAESLEGVLTAPRNYMGWGSGSHAALLNQKVAVVADAVVSEGDDAVVAEVSEAPDATVAPTGGGSDIGLGLALLLAFGGGMILNLMPCVLPVLSIKIFDFVKQAEEDNTKPVVHGLAFAFGVLASFWALAGLLLALRAGGEALGWGFQMQSPLFVAALAAFFLLFGLSMFGVFEIGTSLMGVGSSGKPKSGLGGSFFGGCVATLVATPCTAPFMGSALGFALTQPAIASMAVFTALGAGMAAPYVVLTGFPGLLKVVPKPGAWMETFKQFLGFCLLATVIWLVSVFGAQVGSSQVTWLLASLLIFGMAAWVVGRWATPIRPKGTRIRGRFIALILMGLAGWTAYTASEPPVEHIEWVAWSPEAEAKALAEGKPFFIDFTAKWCVTCQTNKAVAFTQPVAQRLVDEDVIAFKADWTNREKGGAIEGALAKYGRSGIPLNVLYNKGGEHVILPTFPLVESDVLDAIDEHVSGK